MVNIAVRIVPCPTLSDELRIDGILPVGSWGGYSIIAHFLVILRVVQVRILI